ncbi:hypothetical protein NDN08_006465 [Rhodosorus marinus]|uniref:PNPLA domain-containing protein n=1 Tax=Rhodosorus marinus TaxID=101924 RepID=A0AAV8ULA0_9RHOD|nr:hypothetical protein NDN08_006465 [Rhodosorus marinus]
MEGSEVSSPYYKGLFHSGCGAKSGLDGALRGSDNPLETRDTCSEMGKPALSLATAASPSRKRRIRIEQMGKDCLVIMFLGESSPASRPVREERDQSGGILNWFSNALSVLRFRRTARSEEMTPASRDEKGSEEDDIRHGILSDAEEEHPPGDEDPEAEDPEDTSSEVDGEDLGAPVDEQEGGAPQLDSDSKAVTHRTITSALNSVNHRSYGGLYESYVHEVLAEAHERRIKTGMLSTFELATVVPYDLQKELFEEFGRVEHVKPLAEVGVDEEATTEVKGATQESGSRRKQSSGLSTIEDEAKNERNSQPWFLAPVALVTGAFRKEAKESEKDRDEGEAPLGTEDEARTRVDTEDAVKRGPAAESNFDIPTVIQKAGKVDSVETAREFVETVGVRSLVVAARQSVGSRHASALGALSVIAMHMPSTRVDILKADSESIVGTIMDAIYIPKSPWQRLFGNSSVETGYMTQARISAVDLVGYLGLIPGDVGKEERKKLALNKRLVECVEHLSGGVKNGETEGTARSARRTLAILGVNSWTPRVPGQKGLRVLSIDGGGTRALMTFEALKHLKKITGCEIHEMFDVIGGTSTGAIIAGALGVMKKPVEEVEALYRELITKIFAKHPLNSSKMLFTRAYYDTSVFEQLLQRECGDLRLLDSTMDGKGPKVFAVSAVLTPQRTVLAHVFRNYTYPADGEDSRYYGCADVPLWLSLRCSSAAPTFFTEMRVNGEVHADGAIVANNPAAVALHETHSIYPGVPVELLVSCGNGILNSAGVESIARQGGKNPGIGWTELLGSIITSATSTEQTHHALEDLMPSDKYFRFNPPTNCTDIDQTDPSRLAFWVAEAKSYIETETSRFERLAQKLRPRKPVSPLAEVREALTAEMEYIKHSADMDALGATAYY